VISIPAAKATDNELTSAALEYAQCGWWVIPLQSVHNGVCTCRKGAECDQKPGKHPRTKHGFKDASAESAVIREWWRRWPDANIGIVTGKVSGRLVGLDVDPKHGGDKSLAKLEEKYGKLPDTHKVRTGGGGWHLYFIVPGGVEVRCSIGEIGDGLDVKAEGGYLVGAGSLHESGNRYEIENSMPPVACPAWLLELMPKSSTPPAPEKEHQQHQPGTKVPIGKRRKRILHLAGKMCKSGMTPEAIIAAVEIEIASTFVDPATADDVRTIVNDLLRRDAARRAAGPQANPGADNTHADPDQQAEAERRSMKRSHLNSPTMLWRCCSAASSRTCSTRPLWAGGTFGMTASGSRMRPSRCSTLPAACAEPKAPPATPTGCGGRSLAPRRLRRSNAWPVPTGAAIVDQWDRDPWLLNTTAGVVDLRTGILRPARREDYMTKITTVAPGRDCPLWLDCLKRITCNDQRLITYLQRMCGYAMTGSTREHAMFFLYGTGANGKGTFVDTIDGLLGDYARTASIETFLDSKGERHPTELAWLQGARFVTATETEQGRRWSESKLKLLTGGDPIAARYMRQDFFEYVPQFKLVVQGNHKPHLRSVDEAIRRRFNLVPFTVTIPEPERDKTLKDKLREEWPGILQWAIEGALAWQREGLNPPDAVRNATADYFAQEDAVGRWFEDCCELRASGWELTSARWDSWRHWTEKNGEFTGAEKEFSQSLETRPGLSRDRVHAGRCFRGLVLLSAARPVHPNGSGYHNAAQEDDDEVRL
jgi:putative DNA primase/helicase